MQTPSPCGEPTASVAQSTVLPSLRHRSIFSAFLRVLLRLSEASLLATALINYKDFSSIPNWAKTSLEYHKSDLRTYIYLPEELEYAKTHDKLWNATQIELINKGKIHGYLRMYWAKKILEWTNSPYEALNIAIYLNDKYAYDAPSANGYTGILWAIGGLHDRAFNDYPVTGKIRRMTYDSIFKKVYINNYIY